MLFTLICIDNPNTSEALQLTRPAHLARLEELDKAGRVILAGGLFDEHDVNKHVGSLIVLEFDSLADAQAWADSEPFLLAGVYKEIRIQPFKQVFPKN